MPVHDLLHHSENSYFNVLLHPLLYSITQKFTFQDLAFTDAFTKFFQCRNKTKGNNHACAQVLCYTSYFKNRFVEQAAGFGILFLVIRLVNIDLLIEIAEQDLHC